ncbi:hypothetical protein ACFE04_001377 [Oxalis oulophora]
MATLKEACDDEVNALICSMKQEGIVDDHLQIVRGLNEHNGPSFFMELLAGFCFDSQKNLSDLASNLDQEMTDFHLVKQLAIKMNGGTACIGGCRMAQACTKLTEAANKESKEECVAFFNKIKDEFSVLEKNMGAILELEKKIIMGSY